MSIRAGERNQEKPTVNHANERKQYESKSPKPINAFRLIMQKKAMPRAGLISIAPRSLLRKKSSHLSEPLAHDSHCASPGDKPILRPIVDNEGNYSQAALLCSSQAIEKISERDPSVMANTTIASGRADEINLLIKKLTLNFSANQHEAHFSIASGVFADAQFSLATDDRDVRLRVNNASPEAKRLLTTHRSQLNNALLAREINLRELSFLS